MVVDVNRCVGCQTCTISCKHANDTVPGVQWRRVLDVESGTFPDVERLFLVVGCQHCAEPPCVPVCPTGATRQRADGLVTMDYDICIGCAYCAVSCPYQARTIVHDERFYYGQETKQEAKVAHDERLGVAQKCTFCVDRVDDGLAQGLTPGVDPAATPACSASCIAQAIHFGDFANPDSNVSTLVAENPTFQMHAELGTDPQIKYLYTTPAVPGRDPGAEDRDDERLSDPVNPLVGPLQTFWDWRAAMNWCFGGVSSGLVVVALLAALRGLVNPVRLPWIDAGAAVLMGIGLFFVFLKIGRKLRFWRAVSRPQTSWMTRELYVVAIFYPAVLASLLWGGFAIYAVAALAALGFLVCQAMILYKARGIPAWRAPLMPWMIVATGLLEGFGLLLAIGTFVPGTLASGGMLAAAGLVLIAINAALWVAYRSTARARGIGPLARAAIAEVSLPLHIVGHALPAVLLAIAAMASDMPRGLMGAAGVALIAGGAFWKFSIVVRASYQQGFALAKFPQRGSGKRAAPVRLPAAQAAE
jgi:phenylacetyl-CoA:acceptor oxidoreductase subunit 1